ncbi:hypothetical protein Pla8534_57480 [Lignipirellula cremea]|uniref:Uncharacterized protein n=1 Tax=Lignipirellula cremea TaxID=2528010 RepID=A0A518E1F1_9BACT|nr:hypothetical protein Pla8534_57480 [Lignipirellula cremea]
MIATTSCCGEIVFIQGEKKDCFLASFHRTFRPIFAQRNESTHQRAAYLD